MTSRIRLSYFPLQGMLICRDRVKRLQRRNAGRCAVHFHNLRLDDQRMFADSPDVEENIRLHIEKSCEMKIVYIMISQYAFSG